VLRWPGRFLPSQGPDESSGSGGDEAMSLTESDTFKRAVALHGDYCGKKHIPNHKCVGEITIKRGEVCLDCPLCGKGEEMPWNASLAMKAEKILDSAGIDWSGLSRERQTEVIRQMEAIGIR